MVVSEVEGAAYAVGSFIIDRECRVLTIFNKPKPLTRPYFEETYYMTTNRLGESLKSQMIQEVERCCQAYGLSQGPVHAEARLGANGPVLLELAARTIGGQCGQLIEFSLQQKLEELVINGMCGILPGTCHEAEPAGVLMVPITDHGILQRV